MLDFITQLRNYAEELGLAYPIKIGALAAEESLSLYALPGGKTVKRFMDGTEDKQLNLEFAIKASSQTQKEAISALDKIAQALPDAEIISANGSYDFRKIEIASEPFIVDMDEKFIYYRLGITAELTIYKRGDQIG